MAPMHKGGGKKGGRAPPGWQAGKGGSRPTHQPDREPAPAPKLTVQQLHDRIHQVAGDATKDSAAMVSHLGGEWGADEIVKKVSRYIYKAACAPELLTMPWDKMCQDLVEKAMQAYGAACQEADWFYSIDLPPVFFAVAWEIIMNSGQTRVNADKVFECICVEYEDKLDRKLLEKAMWETTNSMFGDQDKVASKVNRALSGSYWPAVDAALEERMAQESRTPNIPPAQELRHVENFFRKWVDDALSRCWGAVPDVETVLTAEVVEELFRTLLAPFGPEDPFSCVPPLVTSVVGRPPSDWTFLTDIVNELFARWGLGGAGPARKRQKVAADAAVAAPRAPVRAVKQVAAKVATAAGRGTKRGAEDAGQAPGHPQCTSEGECIGSESEQLIQHMLDGEGADIYCQACWDSFCRRNPDLEGEVIG